MKKKHVGSKLDDFLAEDGTLGAATETALKRVIAWQIIEERTVPTVSFCPCCSARLPVGTICTNPTCMVPRIRQAAASLDVLTEAGHPAIAERLRQGALPSLRIDPGPVAPVNRRSKLGGWPDLPADIVWPEDHSGPLIFVAQIELAPLSEFDLGDDLPRDGWLWFFANVDRLPTGQPDERTSWRVLYRDDLAGHALTRSGPTGPLPPHEGQPIEPLPERSIRFTDEISYPTLLQREPFPGIDLYIDWSIALSDLGGEEEHRFLGNANIVQPFSEPCAECVAAFPGSRAEDWRLLLQLDSHDIDWGDGGKAYFWIRYRDLAEGRFDDIWFTYQCG